MQTNSFSSTLLNQTDCTLIEAHDALLTKAWKIPAGRVAALTVAVAAIAETIFFGLFTALFSPLYPLANARWSALANTTTDAAQTAKKAAGRIFRFNATTAPRQLQMHIPKAEPKPLRKMASELVLGTLLKHPNTALVVVTVAVSALGAYFFGAFDFSVAHQAQEPLVCLPAPQTLANISKSAKPLVLLRS